MAEYFCPVIFTAFSNLMGTVEPCAGCQGKEWRKTDSL
jgi:hypothetical protein